jgi:starvation-inducible DNA-binding protein
MNPHQSRAARWPSTMRSEDEARHHVGLVLNLLLADETMLYIATRDYHRNVIGSSFRTFDRQFEDQFEQLARWIDDIAERARAFGVVVRCNTIELTRRARLGADHGVGLPARQRLSYLLRLYDAVIAQLRADSERCSESFNDPVTADFLTRLLVHHEKLAWMLRTELACPLGTNSTRKN